MSTNDVGIRFRAQGIAEVQGALRLISRDLGNLQQNLGSSGAGLGGVGGNVSKTFVNASGEITAFGKKAISTTNAVAFSLSSLAAQGTVSFRSLSMSALSFASFFGPQGAIAAGVIATGLVLADFFSRAKKGAQEAAAELNKMVQAGNQRFAKREPVTVAEIDVAKMQADFDKASAALKKVQTDYGFESPDETRDAIIQKKLRDAIAAEAKASFALVEAKNALADARKAEGDAAVAVADAEVKALAQLLESGKATNANRERANQLLTIGRTQLAELSRANQADAQVVIRRAEIMARLETITKALEAAEAKRKDALEASQKAIATEIAALNALSQARALTGAEVLRLVALEGMLAAELRDTLPDKQREADIWKQIAEARKAAGNAIPPTTVKDIGRGDNAGATTRPLPARTITMPASVRAFLDPAKIRADVAAQDAEIARQLASIQFMESQAALTQSIAATISGALIEGIQRGIDAGSITEGLKGLLGAFSQGLGAIMVQVGQSVIASSTLIQSAVTAILSLNPVAALAAGLALVAFGTALRGKGGSSGGGAGSSVGGGYGGGSSGGGLDLIRSYVTGSNANDPLNLVPKGLRKTIEDLRRSTFGAGMPSAYGAEAMRASSVAMPQMTNPWGSMQPLVVNTPGGQSFVARQVNSFNNDRGGR